MGICATFFFREARHFEFLAESILPAVPPGAPFRVWSAACSSGEEVYSIAMILADRLGNSPWEVVGSDVSAGVLEKAMRGRYPIERATDIPERLLKRYCLKGIGPQAGMLQVDRSLRGRVLFRQINLNAPLPEIGDFDLIFLRNVLIYFDAKTKEQVVQRVSQRLKPGGYLLSGHSESLHPLSSGIVPRRPSIYHKRPA